MISTFHQQRLSQIWRNFANDDANYNEKRYHRSFLLRVFLDWLNEARRKKGEKSWCNCLWLATMSFCFKVGSKRMEKSLPRSLSALLRKKLKQIKTRLGAKVKPQFAPPSDEAIRPVSNFSLFLFLLTIAWNVKEKQGKNHKENQINYRQ